MAIGMAKTAEQAKSLRGQFREATRLDNRALPKGAKAMRTIEQIKYGSSAGSIKKTWTAEIGTSCSGPNKSPSIRLLNRSTPMEEEAHLPDRTRKAI